MSTDKQTGVRLQDDEEIILAVKPSPFNGLMVFSLGLYYPWWKATWFVVTDRRLITTKGIFNKTEISLPLHFVQDASVRAYMTGAARVDVSTAGGNAGISQMIGLKPDDARQLVDTIILRVTQFK